MQNYFIKEFSSNKLLIIVYDIIFFSFINHDFFSLN